MRLSSSFLIVVVAIHFPAVLAFQRPAVRGQRLSSPTTQRQAFAIDTSAVDTFYQTQPYIAAFLTCSVKASAADLVAQTKKTQEDDGFDVSRNLAFLFYGGIWQGMFQQFLFSALYPIMFGAEQTLHSIAMQVGFDVTVAGPMLCLPVVYSVKSLFATGNFSFDTIVAGLEKYYKDVTTKGLLNTYWSIWIPAQFMTFGLVPPHFRVVFVAAVSFFWVTKLSAISASPDQDQDDDTFPRHYPRLLENGRQVSPALLAVEPSNQRGSAFN